MLQVSHACFRGSYTTYRLWREKLCEVGGYGPAYEWEAAAWEHPSVDSLIVILSAIPHPRAIAHQYCGDLAFRLKQLLPSMARAERVNPAIHYARITTDFSRGLDRAATQGDDVTFK